LFYLDLEGEEIVGKQEFEEQKDEDEDGEG
jgi:hypothetical protein